MVERVLGPGIVIHDDGDLVIDLDVVAEYLGLEISGDDADAIIPLVNRLVREQCGEIPIRVIEEMPDGSFVSDGQTIIPPPSILPEVN